MADTLATLVTKLRFESGHSSSAATGLNQRDQFVYILNRVQEELVKDYDFPGLTVDRDVPMVSGTRYYPYPDDMPFDNIDAAVLIDGTVFCGIGYGIGPAQLTAFNSDAMVTSWPVARWMHHFDGQNFEVWPIPGTIPDSAKIRFRGTVVVPDMVADGDVCVLPATAILLFAAAEVLAREGAKDAALKLSKAQAYMRRLRVRQSSHKSKPFVMGGGHGGRGAGRIGLEYIPQGYGSGPGSNSGSGGGEFTDEFWEADYS